MAPQVAELYGEFGADLPALTALIMAICEYLREGWLANLFGTWVLALAVASGWQMPKVRRLVELLYRIRVAPLERW